MIRENDPREEDDMPALEAIGEQEARREPLPPGQERNVGRREVQDVINTLNLLIETCKDGEKGFRRAAEDIQDPSLQKALQGYSEQRVRFASELSAAVRHMGGEPATEGSRAGAVHRGWINVKAAVSGHDERAVLTECERGEDMAVRNYREALDASLPEEARGVVERQYTQVLEAHDRVRAMELAQKEH